MAGHRELSHLMLPMTALIWTNSDVELLTIRFIYIPNEN